MGQYELTDGQAHYWSIEEVLDLGVVLPTTVSIEWRVPERSSDDSVRECVEAIVARHEILRTRFLRRDDGVPVQDVEPPGRVDIRSIGSRDRSPERSADARGESPTLERPVRWYLVRREDGERKVVVDIHHMAIGTRGKDVLRAELAVLLENGVAALAGLRRALAPRELATCKPGGRTHDSRARRLAELEDFLLSIPNTHVPYRGCSHELELRSATRGTVSSAALLEDVARVAGQAGVFESSIFLTRVSQLLARFVPAAEGLVWRVFFDRAGDVPMPLVCYEPWVTLASVLPASAHENITDRVEDSWRSVLKGVRFCNSGFQAMNDVMYRVEEVRGSRFHLAFFYNYVETEELQPEAPSISVQTVDNVPFSAVSVTVFKYSNTFSIEITAHDSILGEPAVQWILAELVGNVRGGQDLTAPPPRASSPSPTRVLAKDQRWVDVQATAQAVRQICGRGSVAVEEGEVIAHVPPGFSTEFVRASLRTHLDTEGVVVPDKVVELNGTEATSSVTERYGSADSLLALAGSVSAVCAVPEVDMRKSFRGNGGSERDSWPVLFELSEQGLGGVSRSVLLSHRSLDTVGAMLTPV